jgi:flagellar biosynthetic protein FlhB
MAFLVMAAGTLGMWILGSWLAQRAGSIVRQGLSFSRESGLDPQMMGGTFVHLATEALVLLAPIFLLTIGAVFLTPFMLGSWVFSPNAMTLNFERLDPVQGLKRMFSMHSIGELVKAFLKALLIGGIVWWVVRHEQEHLFALISQPIESALYSFGRILLYAAMALLAGLALVAALDVPFQLWQYYSRLRMTREELRQESKEMEGDPHLKARIRSQQREIARRRMMSEVPKADVVVTNPTHFAVALRYDNETMGAPQIVAKGINLTAAKIREIAQEHNVPLLEAPPLARALYRHAEIGDQIPAPLYTAVAEVMAYVYQLREFMRSGGKLLPPEAPLAIAVPDGLDPGVPD